MARLSGRAKGTRGSVSVTVNRHEELSDRSAPYADFGHGSFFEAAPGPRRFVATVSDEVSLRDAVTKQEIAIVGTVHYNPASVHRAKEEVSLSMDRNGKVLASSCAPVAWQL